MKPNKAIFFNLLLALLAAFTVFYFVQKGAMERLEAAGTELFFNLRGGAPQKSNIIIIGVTDDDISKIGRWPWPRKWHASMAKVLSELGAKSIYFDMLFSEPSMNEDDALLEEAFKEYHNVYLPFAFQSVPQDINNAILPLERFKQYAIGIGSINVYKDFDGRIRRIRPAFYTGGRFYPHLTLKIAMDYIGFKIKDLGRSGLVIGNSKEQFTIPLDYDNNIIINWGGKLEYTFRHYSYLQILSEYKDYLDGKKKHNDLAFFKNSICLVGIACTGVEDIGSTPMESQYFSIGIIATVIDNILNREFVRLPPKWVGISIIFILALFPAFVITGKKPLLENMLMLLLGTSSFVIAFMAFKLYGLLISIYTPLIALIGSTGLIGIYNFVRIAAERQGLFRMAVIDGLTGIYNVRHFKMLLENKIMLAKNDPLTKMTLVMSDIDHFKHINDSMGHQAGDYTLKEIATILKNTLRASDILARYGGEEMIMLLVGTDLKQGVAVAEKLRENVQNHKFKYGDKDFDVTVSFGVSFFKNSDTPESLIHRADSALYKSKEYGRNKVSTEE